MEKILDLHTHLDTLGELFSYRSKIQHHKYTLEDHLNGQAKYLLSVAIYVPASKGYDGLLKHIVDFKTKIAKYPDVKLIKNKQDLNSNFKIGVILHVESARVITKGREQINELADLGIKGIIPMHFVDNKIGNSCDDPLRRLKLKRNDHGLTEYGHQFIEECNKRNLWLDISHSSDQTALDILKLANNVMLSHVGIRDLVDKKRNQTINVMKKIQEKNGVIGLIPWEHLIGKRENDYKEQIQFAIGQGLENNLAIGSDFGAPIKTHRHSRGLNDLARIIKNIPEHKDQLLWDNGFEFFKRVLN